MQLTDILTPQQIEAVANSARQRGLTDEQFITAAINHATGDTSGPLQRDGTLNEYGTQTLFKIETAYTSAAAGAAKRHLMEFPRRIASPREGYALLMEAMEDAWEAIKRNQFIDARNKVMRVIVLGFRYMAEC